MIVAVVGGTGAVGSALGSKLAAAGHTVTVGARDPRSDKASAAVARIKKGAKQPDTVSTATVSAACEHADVVILATPGLPTAEDLNPTTDAMGTCAGKVIIDTTNPTYPYPDIGISSDRNNSSATDELAKLLPECAAVYKAFNTVGVAVMENPVYDGTKATMLYAGPPESEAGDAFRTVTSVISDCGFEPLYVGGTRQARNLESVAELWIHMALKYKDLPYHEKPGGPRDFAWSVLFR